MKRLALGILALGLVFNVQAQKSKIRSAAMYLQEKDYDKAMSSITEAINSNETKDNPDAYFTRGAIYMQMMADKKITEDEGFAKAHQDFQKTLELKPNYDASKIAGPYTNIGYYYFNQGTVTFSDKSFSKSVEYFGKASQILSNGHASVKSPTNDTVLANAKKFQAYALMADGKDSEAATILEGLASNKIAVDEDYYTQLLRVYEKQKQEAKFFKTVADAKKAFPNNKNFANAEINYYISSGKQEDILKKLEEAIATNPSDPMLHFNLGVTYANLHEATKELSYYNKAVVAYDKAVELAPDNALYSYNRATLIFNEAVLLNKEMNDLTDYSAAGQKKYDALKAKRDKKLDEALPYYEKIYNNLKGKIGSLTVDDKQTYANSVLALSQIYGLKGDTAKSNEFKAIQENLK